MPQPTRRDPARPPAGRRHRREWKEMWWRAEEGQVWQVEGGRADCRASPLIFFLVLLFLISVDIVVTSSTVSVCPLKGLGEEG